MAECLFRPLGGSRPEMSAPFDSLTPSFHMWSVGICVYLLPFKSYFMLFIWLEFPIGGPKFRVLQILDPLPWFGSNAIPQKHFLTPDRVFRAIGRQNRLIGRKIVAKKAYYFTYVGNSSSEPIQTIFGTLSHLVDIINCAKFHLNRSRGFDLEGVWKMHVSLWKRSRP